MSEDFKEVTGDLGQIIRWTEEPKSAKEGEKTVFVGTKIQGVYKKRTDNVGINASTLYEIDTEDHGLLSVWTTIVLGAKMDEVDEGSEVIIECLGEQAAKKGGKSYLGFRVMSRKAPMTEVEGVNSPEGKLPLDEDDVDAGDIAM